jgi:thermitase
LSIFVTSITAQAGVLVLPKPGLSQVELDKTLKANGGFAHRKLNDSLDIYVVETLPGNEKAVAARLSKNKHFKFAEVDEAVAPDFIPLDYYYSKAWHFPVMNLKDAWDYARGRYIKIGILDSGVRATHEDLAANLLPGWNFFNNTSDTTDLRGHGTAVSGTVSAVTNNAVGVASIAGQSKLIPIVIANPADGSASYSAAANGITYAANNGARIANISYGGMRTSSTVHTAANYMRSKNGLVFVSAGNENTLITQTPSNSVIVVSATGSTDVRTSWSNYGDLVDIAAPGQSIWTTDYSSDTSYRTASGTSFSSPIAAGVAALMMSVNPSLPNTQIEQLLFTTAKDLGAVGKDQYYGYGRIDAAAAVIAAKNAVASTDTTAPTIAISAPVNGSTVSGIIAVDVSYGDNVSVTKLELYANGSLVFTDTLIPYGFVWDTSTVANNTYSLTVKAYDAAGNSKISTAVSVKVLNYVGVDVTPPVLTITNPIEGAIVSGNVQIKSTASDDRQVVQQILYIDNKEVTTGTNNIVYRWNTTSAAKGAHTITVLANDPSGNSISKTVTVTK